MPKDRKEMQEKWRQKSPSTPLPTEEIEKSLDELEETIKEDDPVKEGDND